mmetsp:Transcript_20335/g.67900  ORF Transcript_20335/g.67900 Transcript_20335/m.67900 type:complete len:454 (-) Transcript_20335:526-1887(-)
MLRACRRSEYRSICSKARKEGSKVIKQFFCFAVLVCILGAFAGHILFPIHNPTESNVVSRSSRRNINNCSAVPMFADLAAWRAVCIGSDSLTGSPYLECLQYWHKDAVSCGSMGDLCSFKAHCSDMASYPKMGLNGFGGGVVLYIIGVLYMFVALAIVCDDYFVPALEVITEKYQISNDVAGATLMAAGGSAPEFFTSLIGVFITKTEVGFSTIVGSAVFNVLFVIAACALVSKTALQLTSWPLIRDSSYYCLTLLVLALFYQYGSDDKRIHWWEALIMLLLYAGYVLVMKYNTPLQNWVKKLRKISPESQDLEAGTSDEQPEEEDATVIFHMGLVKFLTSNKHPVEELQIRAVSGVAGGVRETFDDFDFDKDGFIGESDLKAMMTRLLQKEPSSEEVNTAISDIQSAEANKTNSEGLITFQDFQDWCWQTAWSCSLTDVCIQVQRRRSQDQG